jgi:putative oxidoreductase
VRAIHAFFATRPDRALTLLRVVAGGVVLAHGAQKLLGWFGGHGAVETVASFQKWFGLPPAITMLVILSDSFGALALVLGLATRFVAGGILAVMIGAIALVHGRWGFYMNWYAQPRGEGFEFHLLVIAIALVLIARGGGWASVDGWIAARVARNG